MRKLIAFPALLLSASLLGAAPAHAGDEVLGAVIGSATGALIGHNLDRHGGAIVGSAIGAIAGAAIASNDDDDYRPRRRAPVRYEDDYYYRPAPVAVYPAPVYVEPRRVVVYDAPPPPRPYYREYHHEHWDYGRHGSWDRY